MRATIYGKRYRNPSGVCINHQTHAIYLICSTRYLYILYLWRSMVAVIHTTQVYFIWHFYERISFRAFSCPRLHTWKWKRRFYVELKWCIWNVDIVWQWYNGLMRRQNKTEEFFETFECFITFSEDLSWLIILKYLCSRRWKRKEQAARYTLSLPSVTLR